ncbi:MAG: hypothetical protein DMG09_04695 [Acidobacteria bacterium]|nr:MAG: hypothetical protein DMG09_04695 [Acidobacteriota bacterium]
MLRTGLGLCLALGLAWCCAAGFDEKDKKDPVRNPLARNPAAIEAGGELFRARCSFCHGLDGKGGGRGPNLTSGEWGKDSDIVSAIRKDVPGTQMPPYDLPDAETWQLVAFIRSLGGAGDQPPVAGDPKRGEEIFFGKARCASCHMIRGRGSPFGPELSNVGAARSAAKIRQSILEPSAEILSDWAGARVELRSGEKLRSSPTGPAQGSSCAVARSLTASSATRTTSRSSSSTGRAGSACSTSGRSRD